jgi:hypothetical protein
MKIFMLYVGIIATILEHTNYYYRGVSLNMSTYIRTQ